MMMSYGDRDLVRNIPACCLLGLDLVKEEKADIEKKCESTVS